MGFPRGLIFAFLSDNGVTEFRSSLCKSRGSQVTSSNHDLPTRLRLRYALQPCHVAVYVTFHWCCCDRFRGVTACASFVHDQPHDLPHINPSCPTTYARSGCAQEILPEYVNKKNHNKRGPPKHSPLALSEHGGGA